MKKLTVGEFNELCLKGEFSSFEFSSNCQLEEDDMAICKFSYLFEEVLTFFNPNTICFRSKQNQLTLHRVRCVLMNNIDNDMKRAFTFVCGDLFNKKKQHMYTVMARLT